MDEQKICQDCYQKHDCREAYRQMGENKGPSVVVKVIVAFLLPIVIFIASLSVFNEIFSRSISSERMQTILGLVTSLIVTFVFVLVVRMINGRFSRTD